MRELDTPKTEWAINLPSGRPEKEALAQRTPATRLLLTPTSFELRPHSAGSAASTFDGCDASQRGMTTDTSLIDQSFRTGGGLG
ncbi:hypothetical protein QRX50_00095 [Amycolatopsis carbonis]|uniref:Uncharacterized protein n=1 Tax=Amycolatopsis carbonis TaxID=715471 RepID=A0A9Y2MUT0_9PSEU|nr:hypothetical protein [Amycolatopsis sp. 2-15]WIX79256.1 hypothetical protein QRX50_00095 [Amycolatopsis sp. 2-15]